jgi:hypothetical protein
LQEDKIIILLHLCGNSEKNSLSQVRRTLAGASGRETDIEVKANTIRVNRNLHGLYYEWLFKDGNFEDISHY